MAFIIFLGICICTMIGVFLFFSNTSIDNVVFKLKRIQYYTNFDNKEYTFYFIRDSEDMYYNEMKKIAQLSLDKMENKYRVPKNKDVVTIITSMKIYDSMVYEINIHSENGDELFKNSSSDMTFENTMSLVLENFFRRNPKIKELTIYSEFNCYQMHPG